MQKQHDFSNVMIRVHLLAGLRDVAYFLNLVYVCVYVWQTTKCYMGRRGRQSDDKVRPFRVNTVSGGDNLTSGISSTWP